MSSTEVGEQREGHSLLKRHSSSLFTRRFEDEKRNSSLRGYNFVQSSGKKAETCPSLNKDYIKEDMNCPKADAQVDNLTDSIDSKRRIQPARAVLLKSHSSSKVKSSQETLLKLRGSEYVAGSCDLDLKTKIREQSAKRRINRIMKEEQERLAAIEDQRKRKGEEKKKVRTLRSTTFAVMAMNVSAAGYNFKSFTDKKKWLAEKRMWTRQIVS